MLASPVTSDLFTVYHRHEWHLVIVDEYIDKYPYEPATQAIVAVCACGKTMTREQVESVLNN